MQSLKFTFTQLTYVEMQVFRLSFPKVIRVNSVVDRAAALGYSFKWGRVWVERIQRRPVVGALHAAATNLMRIEV
jgi:hypothetical protein